jgi:hypothetical protein
MNLKLITRSRFEDALDLSLDFEGPAPHGARPFDLSELDKLPLPTEDDPPYCPWWVVDKL